MPIPKIDNATPVVVPAADEKTFDAWATPLIKITRNPGGGFAIKVDYCPLNYDSGETLDVVDSFYYGDVETIAAQRAAEGKPAFAQAIGALHAALAEIISERETAE